MEQQAHKLVVYHQVRKFSPSPGQQVENYAEWYKSNDHYLDIWHGHFDELLVQIFIFSSFSEAFLPVRLANAAKAHTTQHQTAMSYQRLGLQHSLHICHLLLVWAIPTERLLEQFLEQRASVIFLRLCVMLFRIHNFILSYNIYLKLHI